MKLTFILLTLCLIQVSAATLAQKVTYRQNAATITAVFEQINDQTGYEVLCDAALIKTAKPTDVNFQKATIQEVMRTFFPKEYFTFTIKNKTIVIKENKSSLLEKGHIESELNLPVNITGTVTDEDGKPMLGVTVIIKGTSQGTTTNADGKFTLSVPPSAVLRVSMTGYAVQEVAVNGRSFIEVHLKRDEKTNLNDVVVVGFQQVQQKTTTASIAVISGKQIADMPVASFDQALQGMVAGVNIQNYNGQPGTNNTFVVRGNSTFSSNFNLATALSSPLFIVDGVPTSPSDMAQFDNTSTDVLAGININDIESIQVAKDAAATAVWGSRGANGVVTIITKRAKTGKPQVELNAWGGFSAEPRLQQTETGLAERNEKINFITQQGGYTSIAGLPQMLTDSLNPHFNNTTNWQGLLYRTAYQHNIDLSVAGASGDINYRISLNNLDQDGVLYGTGFNSYTLRSNMDYHVTKKFDLQLNFSLAQLDRQPGLSNYPNGVNPLAGYSLPSSFYVATPDEIAALKGQYNGIRNVDRNDAMTAYIALSYTFLPKVLTFKTNESVSKSLNEQQYASPAALSGGNGNTAYDGLTNYTQVNIDNILSYIPKIDANNNISVTAFQSFERDVNNQFYMGGTNIPSSEIQVVQGVQSQNLYAASDYQAASLLSWGGQFHYDFKQKYLFDATLRGDASSRFGPGRKWGYFPSISAGYNIADEKFMKQFTWVNMFKLRGSYGVNGSLPSNYYAPYNTYVVGQSTGPSNLGYYNGTAVGTPNFSSGTGFTNKTLSWEPTSQLDFGFDAAFLNNRINVTVDYYNKISSNQYFNFTLPFYTGYTTQYTNSAFTVGNKGVEFTINTHNLPATSKVQWNTNFNISYNQNEVLKLPNDNRTIYVQGPTMNYVLEVGKPIYQFNQLIYQGVYNTQSQVPVNPITGQYLTYFGGSHQVKPGDPIWKDINGAYDVWDSEAVGNPEGDLTAVGDPNPKYTGGFINTVSYKGFSLSVNTSFTLGRTIINSFQAQQFNNWASGVYNFTNTGIQNLSQIGFWNPAAAAADPTGYKAKFPALNPNGYYFYQFSPFSGMYNENGSYLKINSASLGYRLPKKYTDVLGISSCRIYTTVYNVATFSRAQVPDAEAISPFGYYDGTAYPIPKEFILGIDLIF